MTTELHDYQNGVYMFDAGYVRPLMAAIHLIVDAGRVAIVDTASNASLAATKEALASLGLGPENVDYVVLTHVHLDHAGGAGAMMAAFPEARLVVHPRGARHMADPSKLYAAVEVVYGVEQARTLYGKLIPVPAARILTPDDRQQLPLGGRMLEVLHTPGHAKHHLCLFDHASRSAFTGDVLGLSYRELDVEGRPFLFPTTSPSQFDPDEMRQSIDRVLALKPEALYLTHYSRVVPTEAVVGQLRRLLDGHLAIASAEAESTQDREQHIREGITQRIIDELRSAGSTLPQQEILAILEVDLDLNAQGLAFWLSTLPPRNASQGIG
jgi:glyoxylase-like metal-dependent hydrolase (beta-lactamase superfamily II)